VQINTLVFSSSTIGVCSIFLETFKLQFLLQIIDFILEIVKVVDSAFQVLSRNHALLWYENGKFYLQDTKSSNGTFVNNQRLSKGSEESLPREVSKTGRRFTA
jgi:hypothetical protein